MPTHKKTKKSQLQKKKDNVFSSYWMTKADKLWSKIIRSMADNRCSICGSSKYIQAHHLIPRENAETRHNIKNGISVCSICHKWNKFKSFHANPLLVYEWLQENYPEKYNFVKGYCEEKLNNKKNAKKEMHNWMIDYNKLRKIELDMENI